MTSGAQTIASFSLSYDEAGNVTDKNSFVQGLPSSEQGAWAYAYDAAGRMSASTDPAGETTAYGWDGAGNRTSVKVGASPAEVTSYDQAGLPVSATGGMTYTHDPSGNLIGIDRPGDEDDLALSYDAWGRTTLQVPGTDDPASFELDALGRVVARTQGSAETSYLYAGESESPAEVAVTGGTETLFAHGPSGPLAQQVGTGDPRLLISDLHTDVVGLADPSGTSEGARSFSPWGEVRESGMESVLGFQGDLTDPSSGLVDMGTRLYEPSLGRFTSKDILFGEPSEPATLQQYVYTQGSPVTFSDPTGLVRTPGGGGGGSRNQRSREEQPLPLDVIDGGAVPEFDPRPRAFPAMDLSLLDFEEMSIAERVEWLSAFQSTFETDGWFNGQQGVLRAFRDMGVAEPGSWASMVDAAILHSIQNGMRMYRGEDPIGDNPGSIGWAVFFGRLYAKQATPTELNALWAEAEQAATYFGVDRAAGRVPTVGEAAVFKTSKIYRASLSLGGQAFDPRDEEATYSGTRFWYELATANFGDYKCAVCL